MKLCIIFAYAYVAPIAAPYDIQSAAIRCVFCHCL